MDKTLHTSLLEVAKEFVDICNDNNLRYFMLGGTLLGAIRHKGFIPWDEDMDFGMPRSDYNILLEILSKKKFGFSVSHYTLNNSQDYPIRLESRKVQIIDNSTSKGKLKFAWIDILPLDGMPDNSFIRKIHSVNLLRLRAFYKISQLSTNVAENNPYRTKLESLIINISKTFKLEKLFTEKRTVAALEVALQKYDYDECSYVVDFMGAYKLKEMFPKKIYEDSVHYIFEDTSFVGPKDYDRVLRQLYGEYMKLPPIEMRSKHNFKIINKD